MTNNDLVSPFDPHVESIVDEIMRAASLAARTFDDWQDAHPALQCEIGQLAILARVSAGARDAGVSLADALNQVARQYGATLSVEHITTH